MRSLVLFLCATFGMAQTYDFVLKGGHVIDPKNGVDAVRDVAIAGGKIAAVEGKERLGCEMTLRAGKIVFDFNGRAGVPWRKGKLQYPEK